MSDCHLCEEPICYDPPFICKICDGATCLTCLVDSAEIDICQTCYNEQESALQLERRKEVCADRSCVERFVPKRCSVNASTMQTVCGKKIDTCPAHRTSCAVCLQETCHRCGHFCNLHGHSCQGPCKKRMDNKNLVSCVECPRKLCGRCSQLVKLQNNMGFVCRDHLSVCHGCFHNQKPRAYDVNPTYEVRTSKCEYAGCKKWSCTSSWFPSAITEKKIIKVCDDHKAKCESCRLVYPMTHQKSVKTRSNTFPCCSKCYGRIQCIGDELLKINYRLFGVFGKDIIDHIIKILV